LAIIDEEPVKGTTIPDGVLRNQLGTVFPKRSHRWVEARGIQGPNHRERL